MSHIRVMVIMAHGSDDQSKAARGFTRWFLSDDVKLQGNEDLYLPGWNYTNQDKPQMEMDGVI